MNSNELMVGDLVYVRTDSACRVLAINQGKVLLHRITDDWEYWPHESEIAPIPLVDEILKSNGFATLEGSRRYLYVVPNDLVVALTRDDNGYFLHPIPSARVDYVHELQHLLRVYGIDKKITL